ncbi:hypothetical protein BPAE_0008g00470 [Botrytis paeoniae]|uniref:Tat pathway signal sequence n=1 Tax=Botrytis paeoniae TaxID=278948 RepID=A0A4Z1FZR7_9HELO|nr:hypothetical protein BPAE_0008g00470 [Botrytis paeoniae]
MDSYHPSESGSRQEASEKLLSDSSSQNDFSNHIELKRARRSQWCSRWIIALPGFFAFLAIYSLALISLVKDSDCLAQSHSAGQLIYTPIRDAIVKEKKIIDVSVLHGNPLKGPPSPELDEAWSRLLMNANVRVSAEDLEKAGVESIPLNDGSGKYYAILDVYHQLHCLKYIRHYMYKDIYDDVQPWTPTHVDHCIDSIRQNLMCNADTAMMGFRWVNDSLEPKPNFRGQHECVNWESIEEWASERSFNPDDQANLRHPSAA